jgi:hypothetical protein
MTETVTLNLNLSIRDGPAIRLAKTFTTEAYDKVSVQIPKDAEDKDVVVQPSEKGKIDFLCITSENDQYHQDDTKKLIYKVGAGTKEIKLDGAHVLIGASLIDLLGGKPEKLKFTNKTDEPVNISILVGRKAT